MLAKLIVTLHQFNQLSEDEQSGVICLKGVLIGLKSTSEFRILLYQIEGFYVEVHYHAAMNMIKQFIGFSSTDQLEPYLKEINLKEIHHLITE